MSTRVLSHVWICLFQTQPTCPFDDRFSSATWCTFLTPSVYCIDVFPEQERGGINVHLCAADSGIITRVCIAE